MLHVILPRRLTRLIVYTMTPIPQRLVVLQVMEASGRVTLSTTDVVPNRFSRDPILFCIGSMARYTGPKLRATLANRVQL